MRWNPHRLASIAALWAAGATAACTSEATLTSIRSAERATAMPPTVVTLRVEAPAPAASPADDSLSQPVELPQLESLVLARQPSLAAAAHRVRALVEKAHADGKLPPPELMADVWQVPFAKPYAFDKAGMIMFSLKQQFPPAGALDRMAAASAEEAQAEAAKAAVEARGLVREVDRAFVEYAEASGRHAAHGAHKSVVEQMMAAAKARYVTGGSLGDFARAQLEAARTDAEIVREQGMIEEARAKLNGLLARAADAPLGPPVWPLPRTVAIGAEQAAQLAAAGSPEVKMAERMENAAKAMAEAADTEAKVPMFTAGVSASMPVNGMPAGYGLSFGMSLPWAWGAASGKHKAAEQRALAERAAAKGARVRARADAAMAFAAVRAAERRYLALRDSVVPAAHRALDAARAGYAVGGTDLLMWLDAARAAREIEVELSTARGDLDKALADLDWAAGGHLPRVALSAAKEQEKRHEH